MISVMRMVLIFTFGANPTMVSYFVQLLPRSHPSCSNTADIGHVCFATPDTYIRHTKKVAEDSTLVLHLGIVYGPCAMQRSPRIRLQILHWP